MHVGCPKIAYLSAAISLDFHALFDDPLVNNANKFKTVLFFFLEKMNDVTRSFAIGGAMPIDVENASRC